MFSFLCSAIGHTAMSINGRLSGSKKKFLSIESNFSSQSVVWRAERNKEILTDGVI